MKAKYILVLFLMFSKVYSFSQTPSTNDALLLDDYCQLAVDYSEINRDSSVYFANKALRIAERLGQTFYVASIRCDLGYTQLINGDYSESLENLLIANQLSSDKNIMRNVIKGDYYNQYFTSDEDKINHIILIGYIKNNLAILYGKTDNYEKQLDELHRARKIIESETDDFNLNYSINTNIANAYINIGKLDSGLFYQNIVLDYENNTTNPNYKGISNKAIGDIFYYKKNFLVARNHYLNALRLVEQGENVTYLATIQFELASCYRELGKIDSSLIFSRLGIKNFKNLGGSALELVEGYSAIAMSFEDQQRYDSAYYYLKMSKGLSDSLSSKEIKTLTSFHNLGLKEQMRLKEVEATRIKLKNRNQILLLLAGLLLFSIIAFILYRSNKIKVRANFLLAEQKQQIENTLSELKSTQDQLIQSEKMASLGELTAGIAHEIQNPLNFVNNFSELSIELMDEMIAEMEKGDLEEVNVISSDIKMNLEKINHHGNRADAIVKGMLQHSRTSNGQKELFNINELCEEYLRLSYHGLRSKDKFFNATLKTDFDPSIGTIKIIPQDVGRVILNLLTNAFYSTNERKQISPEGYNPIVTLSTKNLGDQVEIRINDNGNGIPQHILDKIFQPFFTTKPTGQGTGLGLSLSYDIIKNGHGGELKVGTNANGAEFIIILPKI